jgi:hypothetical protein
LVVENKTYNIHREGNVISILNTLNFNYSIFMLSFYFRREYFTFCLLLLNLTFLNIPISSVYFRFSYLCQCSWYYFQSSLIWIYPTFPTFIKSLIFFQIR